MLRTLAGITLALVAALGLPLFGADPPEAIRFEVVNRETVEPLEPRERRSADGSSVLKVEGPRFKGVVRLYDARSGRPLGPPITLQPPGLSFRVTALAIAPDNRRIVTAIGNLSNDWGRADVWDAATGRRLAEKTGLGETPSVEFSDGGRTVKIVTGPQGGR